MSQPSAETTLKKVATTVLTTLIAAAVVGAVGYWRTPIFAGVGGGWDWLTEPVSVSRIWLGTLWVCLLVVLLTVGCILYWKLFADDKPTSDAYREDRFFNLLWRWSWSGGSLTGLSPYCPGCRRMMRYSQEDRYGQPPLVHFECQGCGHSVTLDGPRSEVDTKVRVEIYHRIETGLWQGVASRDSSRPVS